MTYPALADVKAYLKITSAADDTVLEGMRSGAVAFVEKWCDRSFELRTGEVRVVPAYPHLIGRRKLVIPEDVHSVISITNGDGALLGANDYLLLPLSGPPYWCIELKPWIGWTRGADGSGVVVISGTLGVECPADVAHAVLELTAHLYRTRTSGAGGTVTTATRQGLVISPSEVPPQVLAVLGLHRRLIA